MNHKEEEPTQGGDKLSSNPTSLRGFDSYFLPTHNTIRLCFMHIVRQMSGSCKNLTFLGSNDEIGASLKMCLCLRSCWIVLLDVKAKTSLGNRVDV